MTGVAENDGLNQLLRNEWELYDPSGMRGLKVLAVAVLLLVVWILGFSLAFPFLFFFGGLGLIVAAVIATAITVAIVLVVVTKLRRIDRKKANWLFATLQDSRLRYDDTLAAARRVLAKCGYPWEEKNHPSKHLFITYFDVSAHGFSMRVWFSLLLAPPIVEIGLGPENASNQERLRELRMAISEDFVAAYGKPV